MKAWLPHSIPLAHVTTAPTPAGWRGQDLTSRVAWAGAATRMASHRPSLIEVGCRANGGCEPDGRQLVAPARRLQFGHRPRVAPP